MDDSRARLDSAVALPASLGAALSLIDAGADLAARALLVEVVDGAARADEPRARALALLLLAQLDAAADALDAAQARADAGLRAAAETDDRELIHRCMSVQSSLRLLRAPRL